MNSMDVIWDRMQFCLSPENKFNKQYKQIG